MNHMKFIKPVFRSCQFSLVSLVPSLSRSRVRHCSVNSFNYTLIRPISTNTHWSKARYCTSILSREKVQGQTFEKPLERHWTFTTVRTLVQLQPKDKMDNNQTIGPLSKMDPNSYSNPDQVRATKLDIHWNVNFERKVIGGNVTFDLEIVDPSATHVIFDTRDLAIKGAKDVHSGGALEFTIEAPVKTFGQALKIKLPKIGDIKQELKLEVAYETSPNSSALQWMEKEQTAGKEFPYLYSHSEAIHARSLLPCQDTPSTKAAYSATVIAPKDLTVLMSAVRSEPTSNPNDSFKTSTFLQKIPIPSYLIAIVVGKLGSKQIGPRSHVWSEEQFLEEAAFDFSETETMLKTGEALMGPYVWGTYDILVLPPSFPFGGMENPCLTFATPTLLTGDKSLANVIAHEISHSWTGNLVTNSTFEHFWLNEGFTVFAERKIGGRMHGEPTRQFASIEGMKTLSDAIKTLGKDNPLTNLVVKLDGIDPDDSFSSVPYEKGYAFLYYLETKVGGPAIFEPFFRKWIQENMYKSVDTKYFIDFFKTYFSKSKEIDDIKWGEWLNTPGMPLVMNTYDQTLAKACKDLKNKWVSWDHSTPCPFQKTDLSNLSGDQIREFLVELFENPSPVEIKKLEKMQEVYEFNNVKNSEIRFMWLRNCIKSKWDDSVPFALKFVTDQGRMKFIRPIYRELYGWEAKRQITIETFKKNRPSMMYVSAYTVAKDLNLPE